MTITGAHTIGKAQCYNFRTRIYGGDTNINTAFATSLKANCPQSGGNTNLANLDTMTPNAFDNAYYTNLMSQRGLLHSDQVLFNNDTTDNTVRNFASSAAAFSSAFTTAMIKMGAGPDQAQLLQGELLIDVHVGSSPARHVNE